MRFRILGPLEITADDGRPIAMTRRLHRSALALLLLNAGRPCSAGSLATGLWGDNPPLSPDVSLRSCVYGIRKALPDAGRLRTHPSGYLIWAGPGELDLDDFLDLARRGREALDGGNARLAATLLNQAVSLWRDPALADLPGVPARERLLGQRKEAQDALTDARLAAGEHRQVLTDLRAVVAAEPLHEHAWAQLITALYRSGARTEALAAFGRLRMTLISAYGMDPGPELQELHQRVLADDPSLMLRPAQSPPARPDWLAPLTPVGAEPGGWQPMCQLPRAVADFTGRAAELARLRNLAGRRRDGDRGRHGHAGDRQDRTGRAGGARGDASIPRRPALCLPGRRRPAPRPAGGARRTASRTRRRRGRYPCREVRTRGAVSVRAGFAASAARGRRCEQRGPGQAAATGDGGLPRCS